MEYSSFIFHTLPKWERVPQAKIDYWHWEDTKPFRPPSFAQLCGVYGKGLFARLWSFEENPRCVCTKRDEPVYQDSCLEFFLQPIPGNDAYINIETNCNGVYLSQFGKNRNDRVFLKDYCKLNPIITTFEFSENGKTAWGVEFFLSQELISEAYKTDYTLESGTVKGNFYKCGDKSPRAHYGACFPAGSVALGFHNPSIFGNISLK